MFIDSREASDCTMTVDGWKAVGFSERNGGSSALDLPDV